MKARLFLWLGVTMVVGLGVVASAPGAVPPERDTPRATVLGFLNATRERDFQRAAAYLDLRRIPQAERAAQGALLARQLRQVLDRALWIDPDLLSAGPEGDRDDGLAPHLERVGTIRTERGPVEILLERGPAEDGSPVWRVSRSTVERIPALHEEFGYGILAEILPAPLVEVRMLQVALWQWIGLLLLVVLAAAVSWVGAAVLVRVGRPMLARLSPALARAIVPVTIGPVRLILALLLFSTAVLALGLPLPVLRVFTRLETTLIIVAVAWLLVRSVNLGAGVIGERLAARDPAAATSVVPLGRKTVKVAILALAVLAALQNLGINVTGLVAGLGLGGLAVALAAQKTIENLFGGVTLIADQPVRVGDFCRFGDRVGIVEEIGLRSTRVRTLDRTLVSIPNADFAALQLENFARRDRIWLQARFGLRYETTPDQLRHVLVEIRKLLYAHPKVSPDPARVRFVGFGDCSLDLEVFAYVLTADINEFLAIREDFFLRVMDVVAASGTGFAFPSQTTYLATDRGLDEARRQAAEASVRGLRERGELPLPDFPPEAIAGLSGTLDYPPRGTAAWRAPG
jgi:MscS family membrane protein